MKPRNEYDRQVVEAARKLRPLTAKQIEWAFAQTITHYGRRTKKGVITCAECGHTWTDKTTQEHCTCPVCGTRLTIDDCSARRSYNIEDYACFMTVCEGMQVLRMVYLSYYVRIGQRAKYSHSEVVQHWIAPNSRLIVMARLRPEFSFATGWNYQSPLEVRPYKPLYDIYPRCIYPKQKLIAELQRSGYNGQFYGIPPSLLFCSLLYDSHAETLLKSGQTALLKYFIYNSRNLNDYWPSIRIAIRNGYKIADASIWVDYLDQLRFFYRDLRNAEYVCPANLKAEHDRYIAKKRAFLKREQIEKQKERERRREAAYREQKAKFFGIEFTDGKINVRVLESVEEIILEGEAMHHCVFTSNYHLREDSLILSARIGGERVETIEFSLARLAVLQSRGVCNSDTAYHQQIIALVNKNKSLIQRRLTA